MFGLENKNKWYSLRNVLSRNARYYVLFGQRSNGKSYCVLEYILKDYIDNGNQGALVRRWATDFKGSRGERMCANLEHNGNGENVIKKFSRGKWDSIKYVGMKWFLQKIDTETGEKIIDDTPFMWGFALNDQEHDKSTSYPLVKTIMFDEFIARNIYLPDEFVTFENVCSTIIRDRDDVTIFMLGNTISKYCPYFREMGLKHVEKMVPGDIDVYEYSTIDEEGNELEEKLRVAVEFTDSPCKRKKSDIYFAFDNPKLNMITGKGAVWELDIFPHCPYKYLPKEIVFTYFILFGGHTLQCEVVQHENALFTYIHEKTTPIRNPNSDLIFTTDIDPRPNYRRKLSRPSTEIESELYKFFVMDKVFYQDNEVGNIVKNYLEWAKRGE